MSTFNVSLVCSLENHVVLSLYAELESIRNIVCSKCKENISPENVPQHPSAFASHISTVPSTVLSRDLMSQQNAPAPSSRTAAKPPAAPSLSPDDHKSRSSHMNLRSTQLTTFRSAQPITKSEWSVVYNSEVEQVLDISFVHAFKHTSSVYAVRFSPDGNFLAAGLDYDLGRTHIYDMKTKSVMWYAFICVFGRVLLPILCTQCPSRISWLL